MTRVRSRAMTTTTGMTASPNSRLLDNSRLMRVVQEQRKQRSPEENTVSMIPIAKEAFSIAQVLLMSSESGLSVCWP